MMLQSFGAYLAERLSPAVFGPAIVLHAFAATWAAGNASAKAIGWALVLTILLFVQFRLWDDLEDRDRDRLMHPNRVLGRAPVAPFRWLLAGLVGATPLSFVNTPSELAGVLLLDVAFWLAYRWLRPQVPDPVWRYGVLLVKYPVFVALVASALGNATPSRIAAAGAAVYLCACAYEACQHRPIGAGVPS